ncbi:MAG: hypothetical protein JEZ11_03505 [Desulfobacterales bacterium]|nr:hypothetical protein [Desulfobacterales bacterium]
MMRILEHGERVHMVKTQTETLSVDTPEDLKRVRERMQLDSLKGVYTTF